jgi:hypothetical protein
MDEMQLIREFRSNVVGDVRGAEAGARSALLQAMVEPQPALRRRRHFTPMRPRRLVIGAVAAVILLGLPAYALAPHVASWINSWKDPDAPVATAPDVVIANGVTGVPWKIVATETDHGLCLFMVYAYNGDRMGTGGCGLGMDIVSYPSASPYGYGAGGDQLHWVEGSNGGGESAGLTRRIVDGVAATDVATLELVLADGRTMDATIVGQPDGINTPVNFWWTALPRWVSGADLTPNSGDPGAEDIIPVHAMIARDASGKVLERRIVDLPNG